MENPATWGEAEKVIDQVIHDHSRLPAGFCGLSLPRKIADALREAGLLRDFGNVTRFEVINHTGQPVSVRRDIPRALVAHDISVTPRLQDDNRTLKVFLTSRKEDHGQG